MGSVYNRGSRAKPNWWITWMDPDGRKRYEKVGPDRTLAEAALRKIESDLAAGKFGLPKECERVPTFEEAQGPWLTRRSALGVDGRPAVRSWEDDAARLKHYLVPFFGPMRLDAIRTADVKQFIEHVRPKLAAQSIRNCLALLSRLFNDSIEDGLPLTNPVTRLDRATRRAIGPKWDPKKTPFIKSKDGIRDLYRAFPELAPKAPWRAMFAVGVFAGLRTDEIRALEWQDLDFEAGLLHVRRSAEGPLKDDEARVAPLTATLAVVLEQWKTHCQSEELCFPSTGHHGRFVKEHNMHAALKTALEAAELKALSWYQATRHSFASHWVMEGGSLEKLRVILGHSTTEVTLRYAHLVPGQFTESERKLVEVQLTEGSVVPLRKKRSAV